MEIFTKCQSGKRGVILFTYGKIEGLHLRAAYSRREDDFGGIHQKQVGVSESADCVGLNRTEDARRVSACGTRQDIIRRQARTQNVSGKIHRSRIEKVRDVVGRDVEVAEAVIQIQSAFRSGAPRDVVLDLPCRRSL